MLAERVGVPYVCFAFCHNLVPTAEHPPEKCPELRWLPGFLRRRYCRAAWRLSNYVVDFAINTICRSLFRVMGLPPMRGFILDPAELELIGVGRAVGEHWQPESRFQFTGYLRWQSPENEKLEAELRDFCAGAEVPVLTFGSVTFDDVHSVMSRFLQHWPDGQKNHRAKRLGRPVGRVHAAAHQSHRPGVARPVVPPRLLRHPPRRRGHVGLGAVCRQAADHHPAHCRPMVLGRGVQAPARRHDAQ